MPFNNLPFMTSYRDGKEFSDDASEYRGIKLERDPNYKGLLRPKEEEKYILGSFASLQQCHRAIDKYLDTPKTQVIEITYEEYTRKHSHHKDKPHSALSESQDQV